MSALWPRARRWLQGFGTAMLSGGLFMLILRASAKSDELYNPIQALILGAIYALAVLGILRLFGVRRWGLPVAGLISGPAPFAFLASPSMPQSDRGAIVVITMLFGLVVGLLEWNRMSRGELDASES